MRDGARLEAVTSAGLQSRTRGQWARLVLAIYGPTLLASIGFGAIIPLIPLQATTLGASPGVAAFVTAIPGIAMLAFDLPAGTIATRLGERLSIALACLVDAAIMVVVYLAGSVSVLALAVFIHGTTGSIFGLARQTYITDAIPLKYRARGMSSLGGVLRIGYFIGPLAVSALISGGEIRNAFVFAACMSLVAAGVTMMLPALSSDRVEKISKDGQRPRTFQVLAQHRHSLLTVGVGCLALMMLRTSRQTISIGILGALLGIGNGISSGIVMTLGADAAPRVRQAPVLGRLARAVRFGADARARGDFCSDGAGGAGPGRDRDRAPGHRRWRLDGRVPRTEPIAEFDTELETGQLAGR